MRLWMGILAVLFALPAAIGEEEDGSDCQVCGAWIPAPRQSWRSGNTKYVYIGKRRLKRCCTPCQRDINNGKIDPSDPPVLGPRDPDEEIEQTGNKWAVDELDIKKPERKLTDEEETSGFGAMGYVVGILVVIGAAVKFLLK